MNLSELYHSGRIPPPLAAAAAAAAGPLVPGLLATPFAFGFGPPGVSAAAAAALSAASCEMANSTGRDSPPVSASPDSSSLDNLHHRDTSQVINCSPGSKSSLRALAHMHGDRSSRQSPHHLAHHDADDDDVDHDLDDDDAPDDDDDDEDDLEDREDDEGQTTTSDDHHRSPPQSTSRSKAVCEISC